VQGLTLITEERSGSGNYDKPELKFGSAEALLLSMLERLTTRLWLQLQLHLFLN